MTLVPAQIIGELYAQMSRDGYAAADLAATQAAYRLATQLFAGAYRGSGKPFVCHLTGTASVVAQLREPVGSVVAALLHAAFDQGYFPDGRRGSSSAHRAWLEKRAGRAAADLVAAYHALDLSDDGIERLLANPPATPLDRAALLIAVANQIDDLFAAGIALAPKHGPRPLERADKFAELARLIGREAMASTIRELIAENRSALFAESLERGGPASYRIVPNARAYLRSRMSRSRRVRVA
jgi:(p)ppGpp synthase/HD superfamily hydrolase